MIVELTLMFITFLFFSIFFFSFFPFVVSVFSIYLSWQGAIFFCFYLFSFRRKYTRVIFTSPKRYFLEIFLSFLLMDSISSDLVLDIEELGMRERESGGGELGHLFFFFFFFFYNSCSVAVISVWSGRGNPSSIPERNCLRCTQC